MFLDLLDLDPLVRGMDPDPDPSLFSKGVEQGTTILTFFCQNGASQAVDGCQFEFCETFIIYVFGFFKRFRPGFALKTKDIVPPAGKFLEKNMKKLLP